MAGIIVTGGSGYIGQEVVRAALATQDESLRGGHRVVNIDLHPPRPVDPRLLRAGDYYDVNDHPRVKFIQAELSDPAQAQRALDDAAAWAGGVDAVCNLVGVVRYGWSDERLRAANVTVVANLAGECAARGLLFLQLSGTAVHGSSLRGKVRETDPVRPVEAYGRSKAEAERVIFSQVTGGGLRAVVFRATNPIGPELQLSELNKLYESAMKDPLVPAVRGAKATYVSTTDVGRALVYAIERVPAVWPQQPTRLSDVVFNFGVREATADVAAVTYLVREICGARKPVVQLNPGVVLLGSYLIVGATRLGNVFRRRPREPILHYELAKLFKGSHDQDQTRFTEVFEADGFRFAHPTWEAVLDLGAAYKFLTDWADKPRPERITALTQRFLAERGPASYQ